MLVLSLKKEESVMIGDEIEVKVVDVRGGKIRLGFTAPDGLPVDRQKIYEAKKADKAKEEAASHGND